MSLHHHAFLSKCSNKRRKPMAAAKSPLASGYHFQKPLQGKRDEDTKWLQPIILL